MMKPVDTELAQDQIIQYAQILEFFKEQRSFQLQDVLRWVVESEQQRIKNETMAWRVGAGLVGLMFGMSDGFQAGDLYQAMAFGTAAGFAHDKFSEEQRKFLKDIQFEWAIGEHSPQVIDQRFGKATSRFLLPVNGEAMGYMFSIRKGMRGEYLVPISYACEACPGFTNVNSREVMARSIDAENIEILANQFFPLPEMSPYKCQSMRKVRSEQFEHEFSHLNTMATQMNYETVVVEVDNTKYYGYRTEIPYHSDY